MSTDKLAELGEILKSAPKNSTKYKAAMEEIDKILGMSQEPIEEGYEQYDDSEEDE